MSDNLLEIESTSHLRYVLDANSNVVVTFTQPRTCVPCRRFKPHLEKTSEQVTDAVFAVVDLDQVPEAVTLYGIQGVPTVMLYRDGAYVKNLQERTVLKLIPEISS